MRVLRIARVNGTSMLMCAGFFALLAGMSHDVVGAIVGLVVAGAGAMEVHGGSLLDRGERRGLGWLISSELVALLGILIYCAMRLWFLPIPPVPAQLKSLVALEAQQAGLTSQEFLEYGNRLMYGLVALASIGYQGGMVIYYLYRRTPVLTAIDSETAPDI